MAKSRRRMNIGKRARELQLQRIAEAAYVPDEEIVNEAEIVDIPQPEDDQVNAEAFPISWSNATEETGHQKFKRKLVPARETLSRKRSAAAKAAVGCRPINSFFPALQQVTTAAQPEKIERPRRPDETALEKIRDALPLLESKIVVSRNCTSNQHQEGVNQFLKYVVVKQVMLELLGGETFVGATTRAVNLHWPHASKFYRRRVARQWFETLLSTGEIPLHQQGKHVKRRSILGDPDVKERCLAWLRSQAPIRRSIPALRQHLRQEVLPELLELENDVEGADVISAQPEHPLSNDALSSYLKAWGFNFKTGKYNM